MRAFQSVGLFLVILALAPPLFMSIGRMEPESAGLYLAFIGWPLFLLSMAMLIPSSMLLLAPSLRSRYGMSGAWFWLWLTNFVLSAVFVGLAAAPHLKT